MQSVPECVLLQTRESPLRTPGLWWNRKGTVCDNAGFMWVPGLPRRDRLAGKWCLWGGGCGIDPMGPETGDQSSPQDQTGGGTREQLEKVGADLEVRG